MTLEAQVLAALRRAKPLPLTLDALRLSVACSRRDVESAVEWLRLQGEPIVGGSEGIRLTDDPDELTHYVEARRRRITSIYLGNRSLRRTAKRMKARSDLTLFGDAA